MSFDKKIKTALLSLLFILIGMLNSKAIAQTPVHKDTSGFIDIIHADWSGFKKLDDTTMIKYLSGRVEVRQKGTIFYCDSVVINSATQIMEAYGHVHINDNDSVQIYADFMRYQGLEKKAFLKNNVKLEDAKSTLTTTQLDYDLNTKVAVYSLGGKLINGKSVLTSTSGVYYGDTRDVNFTQNVVLVDPDYTIYTDTLLYNTYTKIATFTVLTKIKSGENKSITTTDGYYDLINKKSYLGKRPIIIDSSSILIADEIAADDKSGFGEARGNVVFKDTAQNVVLLCNNLKTNRVQSSFLATINPVIIMKQGNDSIFIAADTLYSARYAEIVDSVENDSAQTKDLAVLQSPIINNKDSLAKDTIANNIDSTIAKPTLPKYKKVGKTFIWNTKDTVRSQDSLTQPLLDSAKELKHKRNIFDIFKRKEKKATDTLPKSDKKDLINVGKSTPSIIDSVKNARAQTPDSTKLKAQAPGIDLSVKPTINKKDSVKKEDNKNRFLEAYHNVRIYSDSLQGIGDSLFYSNRDSLFKILKKPTVWTTSNNQISQVSGDTILVETANNKPRYMKVWNNAIMISEADTLHRASTKEFFNQMSGNSIQSWFTDGQLDSIAAIGNAQAVFYLLDKEDKYLGVNVQKSRNLNFYFKNKLLQKAVGAFDVVGKTYPMRQVNHENLRLNNFNWLEAKRPKSKYELLAH